MARKAIVDRDTVLQLLRDGKTSQSIATQFGVSRQAIDLYRKEFVSSGVLETRVVYHAAPTPPADKPAPLPPAPAVPAKPVSVSLDQMIELLIQSFSAMKRLPELEIELAKLRRSYEEALAQVAQLEEREKKRLEQEARWTQVQTDKPAANT